MRHSVVLLFIILISFILAKYLTPYFYYEQDEYFLFYLCNNNIAFPQISLTNEHFTPLRDWLFCGQYQLFGLDIFPRLVVLISLHLTTVYTLYVLLLRFKLIHKVVTPLLLLFFASNVSIAQAYLWLSTYSGTLPCILFSIIALIKFLDYLISKKVQDLIFCYIYLLIALLFKEYAVFLFPLFIVIPIVHNGSISKFSITKYRFLLSTSILIGIIYFLLRIILQLNSSHHEIVSNNFNLNDLLIGLKSFIFIGIKAFIQIIFPFKLFFDVFAIELNNMQNQMLLHRYQLLAGGLTWLAILYILVINFRKDKIRNNLIIGILMYISVLVPFTILSPSNSYLYLEARYYYLIAIAFVFIVSSIVVTFRGILIKRILIIFLLIAISINIFYFNSHLIEKKENSIIRQGILLSILSEIKSDYYHDLTIFISGNSPGYYGVPSIKIPFQTGFGNILAVHLYENKKFVNKEYFKVKYSLDLYNLGHEGVIEYNNSTFAYFENYNSLVNYIKNKPQAIETINYFHWDYKEMRLINKSEEIKGNIISELDVHDEN